MKKYFIVFGLSAIIVVCLVYYQTLIVSDKNFHYVLCDVGQGDGMYIRTPGGRDVVIDGGPDNKMLGCLSRYMPFWDRSIDVVFLSHGHSDHVAGLTEILSRYDVKHFVSQEDLGEGEVIDKLLGVTQESGVREANMKAGDVLRIGEVSFRVLWPTSEFLEETDDTSSSFDPNTSSLTLMVTYREIDFLLTGDVHEEVVRDILSEHDVDVLKTAHHGSKTGLGSETLKGQIVPRLALISAGKDNSYGHPHPIVLSELEKYGVPVLRTDIQGDIEIVSDGERFWMKN